MSGPDTLETWLGALRIPARAFLVVVPLAVAVVGVLSVRAPEVVEPAHGDATAFSAANAMRTVEEVSLRPHPVGTQEHGRIRELLSQHLRDLGLEPVAMPATSCTQVAGQARCASLTNLAARLRGTGNGDAILLCAHYDAAVASLGASDDGSGVGAVLEVVRALTRSPPMKNDVIFLFSDAEEEGLLGAFAFVRSAWWPAVKLAINVDARGANGPSMMFETSVGNGALVEALGASSPRPVSSSLMYAASRVLPNGTDALAFEAMGVPTMSFAYVGGVQHYHRLTDSVANVDVRSVFHHGIQALALIRHLGDAPLDGLRGHADSVFFDVLGRALVHYPVAWARVFSLLSLLLFLGTLWLARQRDALTVRALFRSVATLFLATLAALACVLGAHLAVRFLDVHHAAVGHASWLHAAYAGLAVAGAWAVFRRASARQGLRLLQLGALTGLALTTAVTTLFLPGASYLFQWPLLGCCLAFNWARGRLLPLTLLPLPGLVVVAQAVALAMDIQQAQAPEIFVLPLAWTVGALLPNVLAMGRKVMGALVLVSVSCLAVGVASARFDDVTPRVNTLTYSLDAATGAARWVTRDATVDGWTASFLVEDVRKEALPWLTPLPVPFSSGKAPALSLAPPEVAVVEDATRGDRRTLSLVARSRRGARCLQVWGDEETPVGAVSVEGMPVQRLSTYDVGLERLWWGLLVGPLPRASFVFHHCGAGEDGVRFRLDVATGSHPVLHVVDESDGIPALPPRPAPWVPGEPSDIMQVAASFTL